MNKFILLAFCMMSLGFIGCVNPLDPDPREYRWDMYAEPPRLFPDADEFPNILRMNYPIDSMIESKCLNLSDDQKRFAHAYLKQASMLHEWDSLYYFGLNYIEVTKNNELSHLDKSDTNYMIRYNNVMDNYNKIKKQLDDHYSPYISMFSYDVYQAIVYNNMTYEQEKIWNIWAGWNIKPKVCE